MSAIYLSSFFIFLFGLFNLLGIDNNLFFRQLEFLAIGFLIFFLIKMIGRNFFFINYKFFYWLFIGLLIFLFFFGEEVRGAKRWFLLPFFNFQPSEFFKPFLVIFLTQKIIKKTSISEQRVKFFSLLFYFFLPTILIFKQPDLGTAIIITIIFFSLILSSDLPKKYLVNLILIVVMILPLIWFLLAPYQRIRLLSFLNPHLDQQGATYNMVQSIITVGSGRFFGRGLGYGTQAKLRFLPENYTDFAFASLVEQFGFFGGGLVIFFFFLVCYFVWKKILFYLSKTGTEAKQNLYFLIGFLAYFFSQAVINMGMNLGLLPITGITLPLISYGGSSLVSLLVAMALMP